MSILYIGLDVSKDTIDVASQYGSKQQQLGKISNDTDGFAALELLISSQVAIEQTVEIQLIVEPTGGYEKKLLHYAHQQDWAFTLVNPKQVRDWAKGSGYRAKTDKIDAKMLAHFGTQQQPAIQTLLPTDAQQLAYLLARQEDLKKLLRQERNRQKALASQPNVPTVVENSLNKIVEDLEKSLSDIQTAIDALFEQNTDFKNIRKLLLSVPGVGLKIVNHLLLLIQRWEAHTNGEGQAKGLTAFVGLDPQTYESGHTVHKQARISKMGDSTIRTKLYMGALGGSRGLTSPLGEFYRSLVGRAKARPKSI